MNNILTKSQLAAELGPAQPQLVLDFFEFGKNWKFDEPQTSFGKNLKLGKFWILGIFPCKKKKHKLKTIKIGLFPLFMTFFYSNPSLREAIQKKLEIVELSRIFFSIDRNGEKIEILPCLNCCSPSITCPNNTLIICSRYHPKNTENLKN